MGHPGASTTGPAWSAFTQNYFSMAFPMILGCLPTCAMIVGVFHLPLNIFANGLLLALAVNINMTVPMALWMRYVMHHSWKCTNEMSGPMFLSLAFLIPYGVGLIPGLLLCPLICSTMFAIMLGVMLYRREMYS